MTSFQESLGAISVFCLGKKAGALNPFACSGECFTTAMKHHGADAFATRTNRCDEFS